MKCISIQVKGKVQGVFFRASTKTKADELGVKGFVKNEGDGSVYIEAEGNESTLQQFIEWCNHGPKSARVYEIDIHEKEFTGFTDFSVHR
ncbi:MAG TPA: acylphosphatase [Ohtaekwangia sp.]